MTVYTAARLPVAAALAAVLMLAGCDKTTTVEQTPSGTVTTTTIAPSADASAVIGQIDASLAQAASAVQSSAAASQALTKVGDAIEDGAITAQVKTALLADPDIKEAQRIDVDTRAGVVSLSGNVPSSASRGRAEHIADKTRGVKAVENHLVVQAPR
jgi:hyperosmotically inducible protein